MRGAGISAEQQAAVVALIAAVGTAIRDLSATSPLGGVPSGELYAAMSAQGWDVTNYNRVIGLLKATGLVTEEAHLLKWAGPKKDEGIDRGYN